MTQELEKIVVSEAIAKELKKAGFPQNTVFGWVAGCIMKFPETTIIEYSAPTFEEVAMALTDLFPVAADIVIRQYESGCIVSLKNIVYENHTQRRNLEKILNDAELYSLKNIFSSTMVEAIAIYWLYLKKHI